MKNTVRRGLIAVALTLAVLSGAGLASPMLSDAVHTGSVPLPSPGHVPAPVVFR